MGRDIDLVAAAIWNPEVGATMAATQQEREQHRETMQRLGQLQAAAYGSGQTDVSEIATEIGRQTSSIVEALQSQLGETNELIEYGFDQLLWASERQTSELRRIAQILDTPERTVADERFREGINAFESGVKTGNQRWFDDAAKDFASSIDQRRYSYMAHWHLGRISFEVNGDPETALKHFEDAAFYAEIEDPQLSALGLTWVARILWAKTEYVAAVEKAKEAIKRDHGLGLAHYQLAAAEARRLTAPKVLEIDLPDSSGRGGKLLLNIEDDSPVDTSDSGPVLESVISAVRLDPALYYAVKGDTAIMAIPGVKDWMDQTFRDLQRHALKRAQMIDGMVLRANQVTTKMNVALPNQILNRAQSTSEELRSGATSDSYDELTKKLELTDKTDEILHEDVKEALSDLRKAGTDANKGVVGAFFTDFIVFAVDVPYAIVVGIGVSVISWLLLMIFGSTPAGESWNISTTIGSIGALGWFSYLMIDLYRISSARSSSYNRRVNKAVYLWGKRARATAPELKSVAQIYIDAGLAGGARTTGQLLRWSISVRAVIVLLGTLILWLVLTMLMGLSGLGSLLLAGIIMAIGFAIGIYRTLLFRRKVNEDGAERIVQLKKDWLARNKWWSKRKKE